MCFGPTTLTSRIQNKDIYDTFALPANTMWCKLLYSGFHTPKAVAYHEPAVIQNKEVYAKVQGSDIKTHLKSRFCLQAILKQRGAIVIVLEIDWHGRGWQEPGMVEGGKTRV